MELRRALNMRIIRDSYPISRESHLLTDEVLKFPFEMSYWEKLAALIPTGVTAFYIAGVNIVQFHFIEGFSLSEQIHYLSCNDPSFGPNCLTKISLGGQHQERICSKAWNFGKNLESKVH